MAAVATQRAAPVSRPAPAFKPIIQQAAPQTTSSALDFDSSKHLDFKPPSEVVRMKDIGYSEDRGVSPIAVSQPFQLFSADAVHEMRREILQDEVMANCKYSSNIAACQIRGYAPKYAPFTYDAWKSPETLRIISEIAGVDLVPVMDFEIGHINFSVKSEEQTKLELDAISKQKRFFADDEGIGGCPWEDEKPVVGWHTDSYPFVCVLMLSDCTNMVGGETALRTGNGEVIKVRGPQMGCAVILQGRYINHQALRALGAQERITSVTSFRPRSAFARDDTVLETVRPVSDLSVLYEEFAEYRLEMLEERVHAKLKDVREKRRAGKKFDTKQFKAFLKQQQAFLAHMDNEMVQDEDVVAGYIDEVNLPDVKVTGSETKPAESKPSAKRTRHE